MHPDEQAFQAALDAAPDDHTARLVFADWLEEHGDPRAEGYRAISRHDARPGQRVAAHRPNDGHWGWNILGDERSPVSAACGWVGVIPSDWFAQVAELDRRRVRRPPLPAVWRPTRREAEDAAALAFARLPPERRAELLGQTATAGA